MATGTITEVKQKYNYVLQTHAIVGRRSRCSVTHLATGTIGVTNTEVDMLEYNNNYRLSMEEKANAL